MAKPKFLLAASLCLVLFGACLARSEQAQQSQFNECQLQNLNALEPDHRVHSEAGLTETWNSNHPELLCAGAAVVRRTIQPKGLHLPSYSNAPQLHFIVQGRGAMGISIPGCAETFEKPQCRQKGRRSSPEQQQLDRHQKIRDIKEGDIVAIPAGIPYWTYNYGDCPLIAITLLDTANLENKLDRTPRRFYLAGTPEEEHPESQEGRRRQNIPWPIINRKQKQQEQEGNILSGFDTEFVAQAFNVDEETARAIQSPKRQRDQIINVRGGLSIASPWSQEGECGEEEEQQKGQPGQSEGRRPRPSGAREEEEEEQKGQGEQSEQHRPRPWGQGQEEEEEKQEKGGDGREEKEEHEEGEGHGGQGCGCDNALEETICSLKLHQNIGNPARADLYNPRAGRISTINSLDLPILRWLRLSAEWVVLYRNGIYAPHWNINANSIIYVTRGRGRVQVVDCSGKAVFNKELKRGQLLVVPQGFAVAEQAGSEGFEFIAFKTNDRAMISPMVGRSSIIRAIPAEVLANAFGVPLPQVSTIKFGRDESVLVSPASHQSQQRPIAKV